MKNLLICCPLLLVLISFNATAQTRLPSFERVLPSREPPKFAGIRVNTELLVLLDAQETTLSALVVDQEDLLIKQIYKDSTLLAPLPGKAKNGILVAELKSKRPLFRLDHVLAYFKVPAEQRSLRVLLNNRLVNPDLLLADITRIDKIEVTKQDKTSRVRFGWDENEEYLNIVTVK